MKIRLNYILAILLLVAFTEVNAQIRAGYVFGINLSTMTLKSNGITYDASTPVAFHFGGVIEVPLSRRFTFRPAALFSAKGSDYTIDSTDYSVSPTYIEIPLNVVYSIGSDALKFCLYGGPYLAFGIGGYKIVGDGELQYLKFGFGHNDDYKPFDAGFNFGAGFNIGGFVISAQYGFGLANISPVSAIDTDMKNKVVGISISSTFPIRQ